MTNALMIRPRMAARMAAERSLPDTTPTTWGILRSCSIGMLITRSRQAVAHSSPRASMKRPQTSPTVPARSSSRIIGASSVPRSTKTELASVPSPTRATRERASVSRTIFTCSSSSRASRIRFSGIKAGVFRERKLPPSRCANTRPTSWASKAFNDESTVPIACTTVSDFVRVAGRWCTSSWIVRPPASATMSRGSISASTAAAPKCPTVRRRSEPSRPSLDLITIAVANPSRVRSRSSSSRRRGS